MRNFLLLLIVVVFNTPALLCQNNSNKQNADDPRELFVSAQSYFLYEDYSEALPEYVKLSKIYPENDNIKFKIGICLLNDPFQKDRSISYLEKAVKNTAKDFKDNTLKENRAPLDAWFFLGNAYRVNNMLDKALDAYTKFKEILNPAIYDVELVDEQITAVKNAKRLIKEPMDVDFQNLGEPVNSRFTEQNAVLSADENSMLFVRQTAFQPIVFYAEKRDNQWQEPVNIMFEIGSDGDLFPTSLSADGKEAFFYGNDNMLGTLYSSRFENGKWSKAKPLNDKINTKYWESHACISGDGLTLYFTSNRKGGYGGLDIYKSTRVRGGDWGNPVNLGPDVNTRYNEETPFITQDGKTLYFSSYGHFNMGGYDVFYSNLLDNGIWSKPLNAGYPINTTSDDLFFVPLENGNVAYMARYDEKTSLGKLDIYRFDIYSSMHPRKYSIKGVVRLEGTASPRSNPVRLTIFDRLHTDTLQVIQVNKDAGDYALDLPAGEYDLLMTSEGFKPRIEELVIPGDNKSGELSISTKLQAEEKKINNGIPQEKKAVSSFEITGKKSIEVTSGEPVTIKMNIRNGSILQAISWVDSVLYKSERVQAVKNKLTYVYLPKPGLNIVVFNLTGLDNKTHSDTIRIIFNDASRKEITDESGRNQQTDQVENLSGLVEMIRSVATGNLKHALDRLDLKEQNILNSDDLLKYLLQNADKFGYAPSDVFNALAALSSRLTMQEFISRLLMLSEGDLKKTIQNVDFTKDSIDNPYQLINYLFKQTATHTFTTADVKHLLARAASLDAPEPGLFLEKINLFAGDTMNQFLALHQKELTGAKDNLQLVDLIYGNAVKSKITAEDITRLLVWMASTQTLNDYIQKLLPYTDGNLRKFLSTLDPAKNGLFTPEQLIRFLIVKADDNGYTKQDVINMLLAASKSNQENLDGFKKMLAEVSSGNLKTAIEETDLEKEAISTSEKLVDVLLNKSSEKDFSHLDLIRSLTALAFEGDPADHLIRLSKMTSGDTARELLSIDPASEGIQTMPALFKYLQENSERTMLATENLQRILSDYIAHRQLEQYISKLIPLSTGSLRNTIENLDIYTEHIGSIPDLVEFLINHAAVKAYTESDVLHLLQRMDERIMLENLIRQSLFVTSGNLRTEIERTNIDKDFLFTREAWIGHLMGQSGLSDYSIDELYLMLFNVMGNYIPVETIHGRMISLSSNNLKLKLKEIQSFPVDTLPPGVQIFQQLQIKGVTAPDFFLSFKQTIYALESGQVLGELLSFAEDSLKIVVRNMLAHQDSLRSRSQALENIIMSVSEHTYSRTDVGKMLARYQEKLLLEQFIRQSGSMHLSLDNAWNLSGQKLFRSAASIGELLSLLNHDSSLLGVSSTDFMNYLMQVFDRNELQKFLHSLSELANGGLKNVIDSIRLESGKYSTADDIINELLNLAGAYHYTELDVIHLLVKLANMELNESLKENRYRNNILSTGSQISYLRITIAVVGGLALLLILVFLLKRRKRNKSRGSSV